MRRGVPFAINIATLVLLLVAVATGINIYLNYRYDSIFAQGAADRRLADIGDRAQQGIDGLMTRATALADSVLALPQGLFVDGAQEREIVAYLTRRIESDEYAASLYLGRPDGTMLQVRRFSKERGETATAEDAPLNTRLAIRVTSASESGSHTETWTYLDDAHKVLKTLGPRPSNYDPRTRPWYQAALRTDSYIVTPPYVFASGPTGLTFARRRAGSGDVVGVDMTLFQLATFLAEMRTHIADHVFLFGGDRHIIAYSDASVNLLSPAPNGPARPRRLDDVSVPPLAAFAAHLRALTAERFELEVGGIRYLAAVVPLGGLKEADLYLGIIVDVDRFAAAFLAKRNASLTAALIVFALFIPIVLLLARLIARPINALAEDFGRIQRFDLSGDAAVKSSIAEIRQLSNAFDSAKSAFRSFARFVPRELVIKLLATGRPLELGGERRTITIVFSDIESFTEIAEQLDPEEVVERLSEYFTIISETYHGNHGTIDKYIGDGVMALWNAPLLNPNHVRDACIGVLRCRQRLAAQGQAATAQGQLPLRTRFGIHCGAAIIGNVGAKDRMSYSAVGDSVNLAARLETLNKQYGTQILASDDVYRLVSKEFLLAPVDIVSPKGMSRDVPVFELLGALDEPSDLRIGAEAVVSVGRWTETYRRLAAHRIETIAEELQALAPDPWVGHLARHFLARLPTLQARWAPPGARHSAVEPQ